MNEKQSDIDPHYISTLMDEYKFVATGREGYMKLYTQTNYYFGLIIATFGISILTITIYIIFRNRQNRGQRYHHIINTLSVYKI